MEKEIENLIEQLTKVRPERLNEEALKLFNTIMAVLDERDELKKENELMNVRIKTKLRIAQGNYERYEKDGECRLALIQCGKVGTLQELLEGE